MTRHDTAKPKQRRLLPRLTTLNLAFLLLLWLLEAFVAERHWLTTLLVYLPQHGFGLPTVLLCLWALARQQWRMLALNSVVLAAFAVVLLGFNVPLRAAKQWPAHGCA